MRDGATPQPPADGPLPDAALAALGGWQAASLPDFWPLRRRLRSYEAWYRIPFEHEAGRRPDWALAVAGRWNSLQVFVNGVRVLESRLDDRPYPAPFVTTRARVVDLPDGLVRDGANEIAIHFATLPEEIGVLESVALGPRGPLLREAGSHALWRETLPSYLVLLGLVCGGLILLLARYGPAATRGASWFGLGTILWAAGNLLPPLAERGAAPLGWLGSVLAHGFVPSFVIAFHRLLGLRRPGVEIALAASFALGAALRAVTPPILVPTVDNVWWMVNVAFGAYLLPLAIRAARSQALPAGPLVAAGAALLVLAGAHDLASLAIGRVLLVGGSLFAIFGPLLPFFVAAGLIGALTRALREAQRLNVALEERVEEKRRELAASWARTAELERDRAIAAERERMMRDMHDGTGGQLVSALSLVEAGDFRGDELAERLRGALADLRLAIDSLDSGDADLIVLLAQARARLEPRLEPHGVRFAWEVEDVPTPPHFGPEHTLHVLRVFQEAVTNVLKHARAKTIAVRTGTQTDATGRPGVWIEIADDGVGFAPPAADGALRSTPIGRGLRNMRRRASELGGFATVTSTPHGTTVRLHLPLAPPEQDRR
ncbi:MAG: hypothetical protein DCC71_20645 [Proteobacteria bacterium]|nr:MAG: hypothetical protein DCC71_20645 [Pseudomonadota bacterium]